MKIKFSSPYTEFKFQKGDILYTTYTSSLWYYEVLSIKNKKNPYKQTFEYLLYPVQIIGHAFEGGQIQYPGDSDRLVNKRDWFRMVSDTYQQFNPIELQKAILNDSLKKEQTGGGVQEEQPTTGVPV